MPSTSGVDRRAATMVPGSSALANTSVKWPSSRRSTASTEADEIPRGVAVPIGPGDQVHGDLGVGVAGELHPVGLQLAAQRGEVLDDAVVHDRDLAGGVTMRVRIAVGGPAVGGPAGMAQPGAARSALPASVSSSAASRLASRPARRRTVRPPWPSSSATPAESYPRYSIRRSASTTTPRASRVPHVADDSAHSHPG